MTDWPGKLNVDRWILRDGLEETSGRIALRLDDGVVTYGDLDTRASAYARMLTESGAIKGDRVLILCPDGLDFAAALFATYRMGGVAVMVNPGMSQDALVGTVRRASAAVSVVHPRHLETFEAAIDIAGISSRVVDPSSAEGVDDSEFVTVETSREDPAMWLFSGGTTGLPKAVPQTHRSLANTTLLYGQRTLGLSESDITISVPKLYFGYATGSNLLFPLSVGASTVLFDAHPTPEALFDRIEEHRPTVLINVPSAVNQMLAAPDVAHRDLSSLRLATSAGEALPESLYRRWKEVFGVELLDGLGTAEMWHIFISNRVGNVRPGTLGKVVDGFEVKACDENGESVPSGEVGRLWVKGDSLGLGYFGDPAQTKDAFRGEWFVGGDLISIDKEGFVTHRGRADDAIKVKGKWFRPQEVESILLEHELVSEVAVVAALDDAGLAKPVAFVVVNGDPTEAELVDWVLARLEPYKHPRRIYRVEELPQTHLGKVDRGALKRMAT